MCIRAADLFLLLKQYIRVIIIVLSILLELGLGFREGAHINTFLKLIIESFYIALKGQQAPQLFSLIFCIFFFVV